MGDASLGERVAILESEMENAKQAIGKTDKSIEKTVDKIDQFEGYLIKTLAGMVITMVGGVLAVVVFGG